MLIGLAIVFALSAVAGGAILSREIVTIKKAIDQNPSLKVTPGTLASTGSGGPETLLLVGDDRRALTRYYHNAVLPHSNEMLLVRFDPGKPWISMLSIPRDLQVTIYPPNAPAITTRFNYAYTAGGIPLLVSTIKQVIGLSVNHVVVVTFTRFKRAVDEMGCVYSTIDHRYYHSNLGSAQQYQEINLLPGYQKLCGPQSLQFVSYRHGDTALIRDARNQSFLLDVKKQFGPSLFANRTKFEQIFGRAVQTDPGLHTTAGILDLLSTLIASSGRPVRQVPFQANLLPTEVTATQQQISATVSAFLNGSHAPPKRRTAVLARAVHRRKFAIRLPLVPTPRAELAHARSLARRFSFPLEYPRVRDQSGSFQPVELRSYYLRGLDGQVHRAYVAVEASGGLDQYYDVQGMNWTTAPLFNNPDQTVRVAGRTYYLYYDAQSLKMVAWYEHGAVYWIRNTLINSIGNSSMLAIAEETQPFTVAVAGPGRHRAGLGAFGLPARPQSSNNGGAVEEVGAALGLLALLGIAALARPVLTGRRELITLRDQLRTRLQLDARERAAAYATGISPYQGRRARPVARPRRWGLVAVGAATIAIAAVAVVIATSGGTHRSTPVAVVKHAARSSAGRPRPAALPPAAVAVLNATTTPGAARNLASQLHTKGVAIATVGNLAGGRPPGIEVLYAPGEQAQATRVAALLANSAPTIGPIDPAARSAAGSTAQLAVVLG